MYDITVHLLLRCFPIFPRVPCCLRAPDFQHHWAKPTFLFLVRPPTLCFYWKNQWLRAPSFYLGHAAHFRRFLNLSKFASLRSSDVLLFLLVTNRYRVQWERTLVLCSDVMTYTCRMFNFYLRPQIRILIRAKAIKRNDIRRKHEQVKQRTRPFALISSLEEEETETGWCHRSKYYELPSQQ